MPRLPCSVRELHTVTYANGLSMQRTLVEKRQRNEIPDQLLLLEHPPVLTLGKGRAPQNLLASQEQLRDAGVEFHETTRGGDITYHGPGQIVGYPLLHLGEGARDIRRYVTAVEEVLIRALADFGITGVRDDRNRGVWVGNDKIAAIGIRIARWVTSHGFALNVDPDMNHYRLITPCGIAGAGVTSMKALLGSAPDMHAVRERISRHFGDVFDREMRVVPHDLEIIKIVVHDGERILLLRRTEDAGGFWQPVTGAIEPDESPLATARRELLEETGFEGELASAALRQSFLIEAGWLGPQAVMTDEITFSARVAPGMAPKLDPEEHDAWEWFTVEEARSRVRWSSDHASIDAVARIMRAQPKPKGSP